MLNELAGVDRHAVRESSRSVAQSTADEERLPTSLPQRVKAADVHLLRMFAARRGSRRGRVLRLVVPLGDKLKVWLAVSPPLLLAGRRGRRAALTGWEAVAVATVLDKAVAAAVRRRRPGGSAMADRGTAGAEPSSTSFPSTHTASAVALHRRCELRLPASRLGASTARRARGLVTPGRRSALPQRRRRRDRDRSRRRRHRPRVGPTGVAVTVVVELLERTLPRWRGRMHGWAFVAAVPAGAALLGTADGAVASAAAAIYGTTLVALFGVSAAYHKLAPSPAARVRMRRLDHSMIFVVIAGTYTPICLLALPRPWGLPLLVLVWGGAVAGIVLKNTSAAFARSANGLYLVLGWAAVAVLPAILRHLSAGALALMAVGGITYTVGAVVLFRRRPDPWPAHFGYHEVWHACTVLAGSCHFAMIWLVTTSHAA